MCNSWRKYVSFSVEVSTLDFDSNIPGSNPGRTTSRNSTVVVHRTCNAKVLSSILSCGLATTSTSAREVQGAGFRHQCVRTRGFKSRLVHERRSDVFHFFFSYPPTNLPRPRAVVPRSTRGGSSATQRRRQKTNERHAAEVTFDGSGRGLQTRGRLIPQEFDSPSTACSPPTRGLRAACVDGDSDGQCAREV